MIRICMIYIYTWNLNDRCFDWKRPYFGGVKAKNKGQTGSRHVYFRTYHICLFLQLWFYSGHVYL